LGVIVFARFGHAVRLDKSGDVKKNFQMNFRRESRADTFTPLSR
jgi:hypothetical protein